VKQIQNHHDCKKLLKGTRKERRKKKKRENNGYETILGGEKACLGFRERLTFSVNVKNKKLFKGGRREDKGNRGGNGSREDVRRSRGGGGGE